MAVNTQNERRILGIMMSMDPDASIYIANIARPDDFGMESHARIYEAAQSLALKGETPDVSMVCERLPEHLHADCIDIVSENVSSAGYRESVDVLCKTAWARQVKAYAAKLNRRAETPDGLYEWFLRTQSELVETARSASELTVMRDISDSEDGSGRVLPTGIEQLDGATGGGIQTQKAYVIAARPGGGKSTIAENLMLRLSVVRKYKGIAFELEMTTKEAKQGQARILGMPGKRLAEKRVIVRTLLNSSHLLLTDKPRQTVEDIAKICRSTQGLDYIIVDHLQILKSAKPFKDRHRELGYMSEELKSLSKELDIAVIILSQLGRQVEERPDGKPRVSDLRESGDIEQNADAILLLWPEWRYVPTAVPERLSVIVGKMRGGRAGYDIHLRWIQEWHLMTDYVPENNLCLPIAFSPTID